MTIFHLGASADADTMSEENVRRILALLGGKRPDDEGINAAIKQVTDNPEAVHSLGVFQLQYRPTAQPSDEPAH